MSSLAGDAQVPHISSPAALSGVPGLSKHEYAYQRIKARILSDELTSGQTLSQQALAESLGVSTTPIREALKRLATEGLVILADHRDARIAELSLAEAHSLYEIRLTLEPRAAAWAAHRASELQREQISQALEDLENAEDDAGATTAHREFHRQIYTAAANPQLSQILDTLWDRADRYWRLSENTLVTQPVSAQQRRAEHRRIAQAVIQSNAEEAFTAMYAHIERSLAQYPQPLAQPQEKAKAQPGG